MSDAVVRERGYSGYDGARTLGRAWLVLAQHTARVLWARKGVRRAMIVACAPALIAAVVTYVASRTSAGANIGMPLNLLTHAYGVILPALVVALAVAGETIAEDRRAGALSFYFARPLPPSDYLRGRLLGAVAIVALVVAGPTTVVSLYTVSVANGASAVAHAFGVTLATLLLAIVESIVIVIFALLASAYSASRGAAQSFLGLIFVLPWIVAGIGGKMLDGPWLQLASLPSLVAALGDAAVSFIGHAQSGILDELVVADGGKALPAWSAAVSLVVLIGGGLALLRARIEHLGHAGGDA